MAYVNVAEWKPDQVTDWLKGLDSSLSPYIQSFLNNNVSGQQLLNLGSDDLDHLGIIKVGLQEIILEGVEHLRNIHYELDRENLQLLAMRLSCLAHSLHNELYHCQKDSQRLSTQILADIANIVSAVKPLIAWLDRPGFCGEPEYADKRRDVLSVALRMATCGQRDRFAEAPAAQMREASKTLADLADSIVREIQDPLILQPASLDLATIKKRSSDDLGFYIVPSSRKIHQISELKLNGAAHQSGKIEPGDEIVQINYQTVVGWDVKHVMGLLVECPTEVLLTLKKRPRHTKVYGQIYVKPYRLPSKKRSPHPFSNRHHLLNDHLTSLRINLKAIPLNKLGEPKKLEEEKRESRLSLSSDEEVTVEHNLVVPSNLVHRRATITGASPLSKRPPLDIHELWHDLKLEKETANKKSTTSVIDFEERLNSSSFVKEEPLEMETKEIPVDSCVKKSGENDVPVEKLSIKQRIELFSAKEETSAKPKVPARLFKPQIRINSNPVLDETLNKCVSRISLECEMISNDISVPDSPQDSNEKDKIEITNDVSNITSVTVEKSVFVEETKIAESVLQNENTHLPKSSTHSNNVSVVPPSNEVKIKEVFLKNDLSGGSREKSFPNKQISSNEDAAYVKNNNLFMNIKQQATQEVSPQVLSTSKCFSYNVVSLDKSSKESYDLVNLNRQEELVSNIIPVNENMKNNNLVQSVTLNKDNVEEEKEGVSAPPVAKREPSRNCENKQLVSSEAVEASQGRRESVEEHGRVVETINRHILDRLNDDEFSFGTELETLSGSLPHHGRLRKGIALEEGRTEGLTHSLPLFKKHFQQREYASDLSRTISQVCRDDTHSRTFDGTDYGFVPVWQCGENVQTKASSGSLDSKPYSSGESLNKKSTLPELNQSLSSLHEWAPASETSSCQSFSSSDLSEVQPKPSDSSAVPPLPPPRPSLTKPPACYRAIIAARSIGKASPKAQRKKNPLLAKGRNIGVKELIPSEILSGWVQQRCRKGSGTWKRRWGVINGNTLYLFINKQSCKAETMVCLPGFTVSPAEEVKSRQFAFKVYHDGTSFYFAAETYMEFSYWLDALTMSTLVQSSHSKEIAFSESEGEEEVKRVAAPIPAPRQAPPQPPPQQSPQASSLSLELPKKFGSLKKLACRCGSDKEKEKVTGGSSLDRKCRRLLGSGPVPVPTPQYRSYRRVHNTPAPPPPPPSVENCHQSVLPPDMADYRLTSFQSRTTPPVPRRRFTGVNGLSSETSVRPNAPVFSTAAGHSSDWNTVHRCRIINTSVSNQSRTEVTEPVNRMAEERKKSKKFSQRIPLPFSRSSDVQVVQSQSLDGLSTVHTRQDEVINHEYPALFEPGTYTLRTAHARPHRHP